LVGPCGHSADVARNIEPFRPGRSFHEIAERARRLPERFVPCERLAIAHGIGQCNASPLAIDKSWLDEIGQDELIEPGMISCVESFAGASDICARGPPVTDGPRHRQARPLCRPTPDRAGPAGGEPSTPIRLGQDAER
jgi:hypothetical protein